MTRTPSLRAAVLGSLRGRLVASDVAALSAAGVLTVATTAPNGAGDLLTDRAALTVLGIVVAGIVFARWQQLYLSSRNSIRSAELVAIVRVGVLLGAGSLVVEEFVESGEGLGQAIVTTVLTVLCLTISRGVFRVWLKARRARGQYVRPVVVVGTNAEAARIVRVLQDHRDSGFEVHGVCGDIDEAARSGLRPMWRGELRDAVQLVQVGAVTGSIVVASALPTDVLNDFVRQVTGAGGHVHVSSGLHGWASNRIASEPIAYEPLLHIHPTQLDTRQLLLKRALDCSVSVALMVLTAPLLLVAMAMVRLQDGGPALFRQVRVGRDGQPFELLKLRTMEVGAEERLDELESVNARSGPLFKAVHDPRVTRLGGVLRWTSIDELPQLWNVLRGEMSLVGPRPALPAEVRAFPPALSKRTNVLPGVTGLWQVEARDNPSFDAYARLDLFYIDNWTLTFDLVILLATAESVLARLVSLPLGQVRRLLRPDRRAPLPREVQVPSRSVPPVDAVPVPVGSPSSHPGTSALVD